MWSEQRNHAQAGRSGVTPGRPETRIRGASLMLTEVSGVSPRVRGMLWPAPGATAPEPEALPILAIPPTPPDRGPPFPGLGTAPPRAGHFRSELPSALRPVCDRLDVRQGYHDAPPRRARQFAWPAKPMRESHGLFVETRTRIGPPDGRGEPMRISESGWRLWGAPQAASERASSGGGAPGGIGT